jgi:hypothetical protein
MKYLKKYESPDYITKHYLGNDISQDKTLYHWAEDAFAFAYDSEWRNALGKFRGESVEEIYYR